MYYTLCTVLHQHDSVITVKPGANVTLQCFFTENYTIYDMFWYKQIKSQRPCAVVMARAVADPIFYKGYTNTRFNISRSKKRFSLSIINVSHWDEGVYYCGVEVFFDIEFGNGVFLTLNESNASSLGTDLDPTRIQDQTWIGVVIFQCNIIGICAVWIVYLCIRIRQEKAPFSSRPHSNHMSIHIENPGAKRNTSSF
ncbi:CMRF35-like molecule 6 [Pseudorasbora parva]|uniref:CMRF35-like molecule 6 n=1 Tax=Pseudorasbora parva TaxID=51549 RepID=UPI00351DBC40